MCIGSSPLFAQAPAEGFDPNANGIVRVVLVQPDGKILLGGNFTELSPDGGAAVTRNHIARLNSDGTLDAGFNPNVNGIVRAIALQSDGKIVIGGDFTTVGEATRNRLARLDAANGAPDSFDPNASNVVRTIAIQSDGKILVGGDFTKVGDETRNFIARLDATSGNLDSFNAKAKGVVFSIAIQAEGKVLVGGQFNGENSIGGADRNYIARLDATTGLADSYNPNANGAVFSIVLQTDGKALVGGVFHGANSIGSAERNYIARLDSANGGADSFNPNASAAVNAIAVEAGGDILIGGAFFGPHGMGGQARDYIARVSASTGAVDSSFDQDADGMIHSIAMQTEGGILIGGAFMKIGDQSRNRIARLNSDGAVAAANHPGLGDFQLTADHLASDILPITVLTCMLGTLVPSRRKSRKRINGKIKPRLVSKVLWSAATLAFLFCSSASFAGVHLNPSNGNGRYFTDENGNAVYMTGSHTWNNFLDGGWEATHFHNPYTFDYPGYLSWMQGKGHNFIRLWTPENARDFEPCTPEVDNDCLASGFRKIGYSVEPTLYKRITQDQCDQLFPGHPESCIGNDGLMKFDLETLNPAYFVRLRDRIIAAKQKTPKIYVSIMLFDGWGVGVYQNSSDSPFLQWLGHPYNIGNNVNMIHGWPDAAHPRNDGVACQTRMNDVINLQLAYVTQVIDTVKDLDNVLFEVANEALGHNGGSSPVPDGGTLESTDWQNDIIGFIHKTEADIESSNPGLYYKHPVGMTGQYWGRNDELNNSPGADWISYDTDGAGTYEDHPSETDGSKVIILDTDHLFNNGVILPWADRSWVWKSFTRGYNPIYMDQLDRDPANFGGADIGGDPSPNAEDVRIAMGNTKSYADRMNLIDMTPQGSLSPIGSEPGYVLAKVGEEYLVYRENHDEFTVDVLPNTYAVEWFNPV